MLVRKVIEKEVHYCQECPYYEEWSDMGRAYLSALLEKNLNILQRFTEIIK